MKTKRIPKFTKGATGNCSGPTPAECAARAELEVRLGHPLADQEAQRLIGFVGTVARWEAELRKGPGCANIESKEEQVA